MFGRRTAKKSAPETTPPSPDPSGKGRPTPKRSDALAARKKRMSPPRDRREAARIQRERGRAERERRMRAMQSGDERYLPARDQGPVRRFVRDYVDSRRSAAEFLLPALVVILVLSFLRATWAVNATVLLWTLSIVLTLLDSILLVWRISREVTVRFPDTSTKGAKLYALLRSSQMRFMRMPKPQVKAGTALPDRY
ncbi:MAG: DUF3043 domain-containing protein [Nocardioidaceae bacterium]